jgi:hypothetical protein
VASHRLEKSADEAVRRPVRETDATTRPANANHLGRSPGLVRREHHAEGRHDDVEAGIVERQRLGIRDAHRRAQTLGGETLGTTIE